MRYYKRLYIGNNLDEETVAEIKGGKPNPEIYAVCVSEKTVGMLEILNTCELFKEHNLKRDYGVIALLYGKGSAKKAVMDLLCAWLKAHKDLSGIKEYYNKNSL